MFKRLLYLCLFCTFANAEFVGEAGYGYNFYRYEEPSLMKIDGALHTIFTRLGYIGDDVGLEANYIQAFSGNLKYDGATQSGMPLINIPSKDNFYNVDLKFGGRLEIFGDKDFAYIGLGYRYLDNRISGSGGYKREQIYYYIPIGFHASDEMFVDDLFARYGVEFRYLFLGINKTHIGDVIPDINPSVLEMRQKNSFGLKVNTGFEYFLFDDFKLFMQFIADYWYVRESSTYITTLKSDNTIQAWVEPRNNTFQFGIEIGLGF